MRCRAAASVGPRAGERARRSVSGDRAAPTARRVDERHPGLAQQRRRRCRSRRVSCELPDVAGADREGVAQRSAISPSAGRAGPRRTRELGPGHAEQLASRARPQSSISASLTISGGSKRIVGGSGRVDHQPLLEQRAARQVRRVDDRDEVDADHQALGRAPRRRAAARRAQPAAARRARRPSAAARGSPTDLERRERRAHDERAAGEGRAVVAGLEHVGQPRAGDQRADRQPAAERLGGRHRVGHDRRSAR